MEVGSLGLLGLSLPQLLALEDQARARGKKLKDTAVIFIWLPGGPPHMETYDMKPDAPIEYRGAFRPIKTNVPGIEVCEHLPLHAKIADKFTLVRSCHHAFSDHGGGHKRFMTARDPKEPTGFVNDAPAMTSYLTKVLDGKGGGIPPSIAGVDQGRQGINTFSLGSAWLGSGASPFMVVGDPSKPDFKVENISLTPDMESRLDDRMHLLQGMDRLKREIDHSGVMDAMDTFSQRAVRMLTSDAARTAFDLSREPDRVRERYGMHLYGQRGLLARRLVEAGCRFVTMVWEKPHPNIPKNGSYNWDSHAVNCHLFNDALWRFPYYDQALTALIEDLYERGLDRDVLVIATGEFGRTPKISHNVGTQTKVSQPGRDHWPQAMSMLVSGGGMRTGQVVGATNSRGEHPIERALSPNDIWATAYRHLGIDTSQTFLDFQGRPMPILSEGEPIEELLPVT
ncbi:MAG: hypothetical protein ACI9TH_003836 [Kiritimatiellia bacterium]|jgi:hypothetical protein